MYQLATETDIERMSLFLSPLLVIAIVCRTVGERKLKIFLGNTFAHIREKHDVAEQASIVQMLCHDIPGARELGHGPGEV